MSFNQDIIDFMNGTNKNKSKKNSKNSSYLNDKKYQKNSQEKVDNEQGIVVANDEDDENSDEDYNRNPNERLTPTTLTRKSPSYINKPYNTMIKNFKKSYYEVIREWIEIDQQQIYTTLQSIDNLRQRIHHAFQFASSFSTEYNDGDNTFEPKLSSTSWRINGYRHHQKSSIAETAMASSTLNSDDLQMTIQHNLQHHERMIVQLRHLISELGNMTNRMSRRYEDLHHCCCSMLPVEMPTSDVLSTMDECQMVYIAFAKELYRKQILITQIVDIPVSSLSDSDDMFGITNDDDKYNKAVAAPENNTKQNHSPRSIIRQCIQEWPFTSEHSHVYPYKQFVHESIKRYR
jgi:hypothetical protein